MLRSDEYRRGYDAGYKAALLDALKLREASDAARRRMERVRIGDGGRRIGGPDSPFKPRGVPGSIYNDR